MDKNLSYLFGVMCGDGYIHKNNLNRNYYISLKSIDKDFLVKFRKVINSLIEGSARIWKEKNKSCKQGFHWKSEIGNKRLFLKIKDFKRHQSVILSKNKRNKISFLEGLYDSEGCVTDFKFSNRIHFNSTNRKTIHIVKTLLEEFKLNPHLYVNKNRYPKYYDLYLCTKKEFIKFHRIIHFSIGRKEKRVLKLISKSS